jgi:plasmid stabilization system protein ParE
MAGRPERYRLSRRAEADLEAIYDYAVERRSKSQADRYTAI